LNGHALVDTKLAGDKANGVIIPGLGRQKGRIGLQAHTGQVRFRNIEILELSQTPPTTRPKSVTGGIGGSPASGAGSTNQTLAGEPPVPPAGPVVATEEEWKSLFNGKDLAGWQGDSVHWSVQDGAITGKTTPTTTLKGFNTCLVWQGGKPSDFELRLKFRIQGGNSGVQYRSKVLDPAKGIVSGYQADIDTSGQYTGINHEEKGRGILVERGQKVEIDASGKKKVVETLGDKDALLTKVNYNDWNEYTITAKGNHLTHVINGVRMSEVIDNQSSHAATSGVIALQLHAGPLMMVQFKDIWLKKLNSR
jgi:hypothetical protein